MTALADTSLFVALESGRDLRTEPPSDIAVSVITIGELRLGVLMADTVEIRNRRLTTLQMASLVVPLEVDDRVAAVWAGLVASLRELGRRLPLNDSWIAATAMAHGMPVVTQDADYRDIPGLDVIEV
ncbi:MAG: type II toxin-antitoxin system VapC family toxin [Acidimicrobiia bacterium]